jgi:hypothetical protein
VELIQRNAVSVSTDKYNRLLDAADLLRELREALASQDFGHWRNDGRQMWIERIDALNVETI